MIRGQYDGGWGAVAAHWGADHLPDQPGTANAGYQVCILQAIHKAATIGATIQIGCGLVP